VLSNLARKKRRKKKGLLTLSRFFLPKEIKGVLFQDVGPLKNDPLVSALLEIAIILLLVEVPNFIISLGTGTPRVKGKLYISGPLRL
jgi:hypothetical protein